MRHPALTPRPAACKGGPRRGLAALALLACAIAGPAAAQQMLAEQDRRPDRATLLGATQTALPLAAMRDLGVQNSAGTLAEAEPSAPSAPPPKPPLAAADAPPLRPELTLPSPPLTLPPLAGAPSQPAPGAPPLRPGLTLPSPPLTLPPLAGAPSQPAPGAPPLRPGLTLPSPPLTLPPLGGAPSQPAPGAPPLRPGLTLPSPPLTVPPLAEAPSPPVPGAAPFPRGLTLPSPPLAPQAAARAPSLVPESGGPRIFRQLSVQPPDLTGPADAPTPALAPRSVLRERVAENIELRNVAAIPPAPAPGEIGALPLAQEKAPSLLQLTRRLTGAEIAALAGAGVGVESRIGGSTYVVSADAGRLDRSGVGALVTAGRAMTPGDKLRAGAQDLQRTGVPQAYHLTLAESADPEAFAEGLRAEGVHDALPAPGGLTATLTPAQVDDAAARPDVLAVDAAPVGFLPLNMAMRAASDTDAAQDFAPGHTPPLFHGLSGKGTRIAIHEPVDEAHQDFCSFDGNGPSDRFFHRGSTGPMCDAQIRNSRRGTQHGTHVAAIAAGSGRNSVIGDATGATPPFGLRGVAPQAGLSERETWQFGRADLAAFLLALAEDEADVSNHSYVETLGGYDAASAAIDAAISGRALVPGGDGAVPPHPQVWAAGNNGLAAQYGDRTGVGSVLTQAKNAISVGSIDTATGLVSLTSSLGPTMDGRIKPDLVAPGCHDWPLHARERAGEAMTTEGGIRSAWAGRQGYTHECGTSQAAPVIAGAIALMCEAAGPDCRDLAPSTFKAVLVATARDLAAPAGERVPRGYGAGPDFASGFGLVDVAAAARMAADPRQRREAVLAQDGEVASFCFAARPGAGPVRLALAWDDPPPAPTDFTVAKLVNDLDLVLIDPQGVPHPPWALPPNAAAEDGVDGVDGALPQAAPGRDYLNNIELAEAPAAPGAWRAEVRAATMGDGPQRLSLAGNVTFACDDP